jgi:hypothetical protein
VTGDVAESGIEVVTIVRGREPHLRNLVRGLARSQLPPAALHVVIMGGEDPTTRLPSVSFPIRRIWCLPARDGRLPLARARNAGLQAVRGPRVVFLDVDCIPGRRLVAEYDRTLVERDVVAMGEVRYLEPGAVDRPWTERDLVARSEPHPGRTVPETATRCDRYELFWSLSFASRTARLRQVGGFDVGYVGYGAEDTDLGHELQARSVPLWWVPPAVAFHQYHDAPSPPVQHLEDIVANARRFRAKWGLWPMTAWLEGFAERGLIDWDPQGTTLHVRGATTGLSEPEAIGPTPASPSVDVTSPMGPH